MPTALQNPRGFPIVVGTDEGGALAYDSAYVGPGTHDVFVHFRPAWAYGGVDNGDVYYRTDESEGLPVLYERTGTVLVVDGDGFVRRTLDEVAARGWPGTPELVETPDATVIEADGLNDYIDAEQPYWAGVPELFGLQLKQYLFPSEQVSVEFDDASTTLTVSSTGYLDDSFDGETWWADSVAGRTWTIDVAVGDDGLFRFVSGSATTICTRSRNAETGFCN